MILSTWAQANGSSTHAFLDMSISSEAAVTFRVVAIIVLVLTSLDSHTIYLSRPWLRIHNSYDEMIARPHLAPLRPCKREASDLFRKNYSNYQYLLSHTLSDSSPGAVSTAAATFSIAAIPPLLALASSNSNPTAALHLK
ncbi:uncharacterized protein RAG0_15256 [Rhynchosporium agropyri]|uniref:Uncharacterized protein n=1 Tax=Rhynchosporium agropyri TaxID=914238 RepID=A0A1E1LKC2_9HELO|nr:uncharacterized protein RAG0_15256 [Rhynchosporium agropyri]